MGLRRLLRGDRYAFNFPELAVLTFSREDDIVIVVMGLTGSGKSSFIGQFDTDREVGIGRSLESCKFHE